MPDVKDTMQHLVAFNLADEEYGITITQVQEVIRKPAITRIPGMPDFIEGVINLRGKIIPVIDLRKRFELELQKDTDKTRIVVAQSADQVVGLIVDAVSEVINLDNEQIDPIPPTITAIDAEYLSGVGKMEKRLVILINLENLLSDLERVALEHFGEKEQLEDKTNEPGKNIN